MNEKPRTLGEILREAERLPEQEEIIILEDGTILLDKEGPVECEEIGKRFGGTILCG